MVEEKKEEKQANPTVAGPTAQATPQQTAATQTSIEKPAEDKKKE